MRKLIALVFGLSTAVLAIAIPVQASPVCCSSKVEVEITPFDLVSGAYQGRFVNQGIPSFAVFEQKTTTGEITGEDLVRAAFMEYRATYQDLSGQTDLIKDVNQLLRSKN